MVGEVIRKETIALLELEKKTKFQMKDTETAKLANLRNLAVGMEQRIREATNSLKSKQETLTRHAEDRHNSQEQFLQIESNLATDLVRLLSHTSECYRRQLAHNKELLALCDHFFTTENDWVERCKEGKLTLEELDSLLLTKGSYHLDWKIRSCHANLSPRLCGAAEDVESSFLEVRLIELNLNQKLYKFKLEQSELELEAFLNFDSTRKTCVDVLGHFQHRLLRQRKQRSLQKELEERRLRLEDMRGLRLKTMRRDREALNLKKLQEQKLREKKFAKELNDSKTVRQVNKLRKQAQELRRNMIAALLGIEAPPDEETGRMMDALAEFSADNMEDRPRALRKLKFTVGEVETSYFSRQMAMLAEKKLPHFIKHPKSIGRQVSLWFQTTYDAEHFITAVDIGHATKESRLHKNLTSSGYEAVEHSGLKIVIWVKRDSSKLSAVSAVDFGFSEAEEQMFEMEGMEMIGPNLFEFDLPDSSLWLKRIDKVMNKPSKASSAVATNSAISQLQKVREFLVENPASQKMLDMEQRLIEDLKICYKKEEESGIDDPIKASKRLMALDENELDGWLDCFERLDGEKEGRINVKLIIRALGEKATEAGLEIFRSMHGIDEDGNLEFGDFILSVGTFCFFGEADVLKFLYNFADVTKRGVITHAEYIDLLNDLHPLDKARAIRTLKRMQRALTDIVSFESFVETHKTFPAMLFPFFQLQKALRKHFMGEAWWMHKLTKYQATREKLTMEAESMDRKAEAELLAFDENEERKKRTEQRAKAILQETSAIKLALLNARQFADALK